VRCNEIVTPTFDKLRGRSLRKQASEEFGATAINATWLALLTSAKMSYGNKQN